MRRFHFVALTVALFLGMGLAVSCGGDDDDDTGRQGGTGDDDDSVYSPGDSDADDDGTSDDDDTDDDADDDDNGGLTWQDPPSGEWMIWEVAIEYCENFSFDDRDDWRLPTISELRSLIRGCDATEPGGSCGVTDDCTDTDCWSDACDGCEYLEGPGEGGAYWPDGMTGEINWYWSSSPIVDYYNDGVYYIDFEDGRVNAFAILIYGLVRCVR